MSSNPTLGMETRVRKQQRERRDANAGEAIPGLLNDIVVTHVLRSEYFDDPADLARLPAVSRVMRDAVAATGLRFEELGEHEATITLGCVSAVERLYRGGRLSRQEYLCAAAARSGQLEKLKEFRADGWPWDTITCWVAALGTAVGARERLPVELVDVREGGKGRSPRGATVGARERLACGTQTHARARRRAGTLRYCSGRAQTAVRGTRIRAPARQGAEFSRCCSGRARTAARGTIGHARSRRRAGTSRYCSGRVRTAARGAG